MQVWYSQTIRKESTDTHGRNIYSLKMSPYCNKNCNKYNSKFDLKALLATRTSPCTWKVIVNVSETDGLLSRQTECNTCRWLHGHHP